MKKMQHYKHQKMTHLCNQQHNK